MKSYVDGYVLVVPKKNFNKYKKMASDAGKIWKKFGALEYIECIGDDLNPDMGGMKSYNFQKMTKLKKNENVWFSFIIYKNKKHRDSVNKKVTNYFKKKYPDSKHHDMPFDMKRMAYGGFKAVVEK
jgi:uncharacterized protein YbaA (DUF1428 family)